MTIIVLVSLVVLIGAAYYFYKQNKDTQFLLKNPAMASKLEADDLTKKIGVFMELPAEQPTIVTVVDKEKLQDQNFFKKAENGDKVIIYANEKMAILYRPSTKKIIEVAPVTSENSGAVQRSMQIALYNGTKKAGMTADLEKQLTLKLNNIAISSKVNAKKTDYENTFVVDVVGDKPELAKQLADLINAQVSDLPEGEDRPSNADLLVIIGADYTRSVPAATESGTTTQ